MGKSTFRFVHQEVISEVKKFSNGGAYANVPNNWKGQEVIIKLNNKWDLTNKLKVKSWSSGGAYINLSTSLTGQEVIVKLIEDKQDNNP
jgi:phosphoribosylpyrophosphate synthetase